MIHKILLDEGSWQVRLTQPVSVDLSTPSPYALFLVLLSLHSALARSRFLPIIGSRILRVRDICMQCRDLFFF